MNYVELRTGEQRETDPCKIHAGTGTQFFDFGNLSGIILTFYWADLLNKTEVLDKKLYKLYV